MSKSTKIKGDGNIVGNNNVQTFNKRTTSPVSRELIELITKFSASKEERDDLESALEIVQDKNQSAATKTVAASKIAKYLKTVAGEAGRVILGRMLDSGIDWEEHIATVAGML
jgi:hypothetical protein